MKSKEETSISYPKKEWVSDTPEYQEYQEPNTFSFGKAMKDFSYDPITIVEERHARDTKAEV